MYLFSKTAVYRVTLYLGNISVPFLPCCFSPVQFMQSSVDGVKFIPSVTSLSGERLFCKTAKDETTTSACMFYVAVWGGGDSDPPMHLTVTALTTQGVTVS